MTTIHMGARPGARTATTPERESRWEDFAACQGTDLDFSSTGRDEQAAAKRVCNRCSVRDQCLAWALDKRQDDGVLGGLTEAERRTIHKRWKRPPEGKGHITRAEQIAENPQDFLGMVAAGMTSMQIAGALNTNAATVNKVHGMLAPRFPDVLDPRVTR